MKVLKKSITGMIMVLIVVVVALLLTDLIVIFSMFSSIRGLATAIDISGSERMRTILLTLYTNEYVSLDNRTGEDADVLRSNFRNELNTYETFLAGLRDGNPSLGLDRAPTPLIKDLIHDWQVEWEGYRATLEHAFNTPDADPIPSVEAVRIKNLVHKVVAECTAYSNRIQGQVNVFIISIFFLILISGIVMILFIRNRFLPIKELLNTLSAISQKDLRVRSAIVREDEIGSLGNMINKMGDNLNSFLLGIRSDASDLTGANMELVAVIAQSSATIQEMIPLISQINRNLDMHKSLLGMAITSIKGIHHRAQDINSAVDEQTSSTQLISEKIKQMVSSVEAVNHSTDNAESISLDLIGTVQQGGSKVGATKAAMEEIADSFQRISEVVVTISKIASTTNLLSMNASIEAAHAGEAGRGFAVVADEIRNLAMGVASSTSEIKAIVKNMMERIDAGTRLADDASSSFIKIQQVIDENVKWIKEIASATAHQAVGIQEIASAITQLFNNMNTIKEASLSNKQENSSLMEISTSLDQIATEIVEASAEQDSGSKEILQTLTVLQNVSDTNRNFVEQLHKQIESFKVQERR